MTEMPHPEEEIFRIARGIADQATRSAYLHQACGNDNQLFERIVDLLRVTEDADSFLENPPPGLEPTVELRPVTEKPGDAIANFKLLQKIGEGGFGVVYMAEQTKPVKRRAALKIIKPGMDTREVIARFEAERQSLAMMNHPNIAKVHDGGETESGRPYFVMELVNGVPLTRFCDEQKLTTTDRLKLFSTVCNAIQHAHQKGVIHRDIKPANVMVTLHDGKPVPKVIDFGISKAINQQLTEKTLFTSYGQMVGTPQYMSPEQAERSGLDVDTRCDIYSLGVLLYELLTGSTPLEANRLREAGFAEMQRLIKEEEPPKPSTRVSAINDQVTASAKQRGLTPDALSRSLRGDLDWIVMKALDKDRNRRYETANGFAEDIERFLTSQPVLASPPATAYRIRKFVARNRGLVASVVLAGAGLMFCLAIAVGASIRIAGEAEQAKQSRFLAEKRANELKQTLSKYHNLLIESALVHAASGDIEKVRETIRSTDDSNFPPDWRDTLEGLAYLHRGDNERAIKCLVDATERNPANVSAQAMLALAYFHTGSWNRWVTLAARLRFKAPRKEFKEFDELFLAYAWFYSDPKKAADQLRSTVDKHPTWVIPRTMLANLLAHQALFYEESQLIRETLIREALTEIQLPMLQGDENPFIWLHSQFVYQAAIRILGDESGQYRAIADRLSESLGKYPEYTVGGIVRGSYYHRVYGPEKARPVWEELLHYGKGMIVHWPASALYSMGEGKKVTSHRWPEPEAKVARAYILALSEDPSEIQQAREIFNDLRASADTWLMRHLLIQIPLLLQEYDSAKSQCQEWLGAAVSDETSLPLGGWETESIEFIANPSRRLFNTSSTDPKERFYANYEIALVRFANGNLLEAVEHLEGCGSYDVPQLRWWVDGFKKEFEARLNREQFQ